MKKNILENSHFIFDLDGVVYEGDKPIYKAIESLCNLGKKGKKIFFFSNNATKTTEEFAEKISSMGFKCEASQIVTSAFVCAESLASQYKKKCSVFVIGENGFITALKNSGFKVINEEFSHEEIIKNKELKTDIVAVGLDRHVSYQKFAAATLLIARGAHFYASNTDPTLPDVSGFLPGAGSLVSFMKTASENEPIKVFGKPDPEGIFQILKKSGASPENCVMIGDRIDTDILCGKKAGVNTALVLTGYMKRDDLKHISENESPDYILNDLSELFI